MLPELILVRFFSVSGSSFSFLLHELAHIYCPNHVSSPFPARVSLSYFMSLHIFIVLIMFLLRFRLEFLFLSPCRKPKVRKK